MSDLTYHIIPTVRNHIIQYRDKTAYSYRIAPKTWKEKTWGEFGEQLDQLSRALLAQGVQVQDKVGIFSQNTPKWILADLSSQQIRAVSVSIYATNTGAQAAYIINDADISVLFVGDQEQYDTTLEIVDECPKLKTIVAISNDVDIAGCDKAILWDDFIALGDEKYQDELASRISELSLDDMMTLIYTSGTTGQPKGVILTQANFAGQTQVHNEILTVNKDDTSLCFLPLSHVYERAWTLYAISRAAHVYYLDNPQDVRYALLDVRPTTMCAVPRFYEKIYSTIHEGLVKAPRHKKVIFTWAVNMGARVAQRHQDNKEPSWLLKRMHKLAEHLVLNKIRAAVGGRIRMMPCGGAKLDPTIGRFFHAIGINIKLGYGMTETTATVSCWDDKYFQPDSVGRIIPGTEVKIGDENEILVKGPAIMQGYYNNPEETAKVFTEDGFLKTGDAGYIDENNNLFITDRIKELMKTSNGKYIAPQAVEGVIGKDHFIEQIAVIADTKKFVSALIVPAYEALEEYAKELNIQYKDRVDLLKKVEIREMFEGRLSDLQKELAKFEQVKKFTLLSKAFSMDEGELTPTLKLRRKVISERYKQKIDAMYDESKEKMRD